MDDKVLSDVSLALSTSSPVSDAGHGTLSQALFSFSKNVNCAHLSTYAAEVLESFEEALHDNSQITMLPNYSIDPSGYEHGDFLVVDLGGSTLRVAVISISRHSESAERKDRISIHVLRKWTVENSFKTVDKSFFVWICHRIQETLAQQSTILVLSVITTGITWSFPLQSTSYNTANILHMAKGYVVAEDVHGQDLKYLLELTLLEHCGIRANVQSIINDSLAVYSAARFLDSHTQVALVLGTGFNVCCQLNTSPKIAQEKHLGESRVLFNTETSLFGHNLMPLSTRWDEIIDLRFSNSLHFSPHMSTDPITNTLFQPFELLSSGRYLPELARLVLLEMVEQKEIFADQKNFSLLHTPYEGFSGELMCFIAECTNNEQIAREIERKFSWKENLVPLCDVVHLQLLVNTIIRRLAYIVAIAIVAYLKLLVHHNGTLQNVITIGYVGSVMEYFVKLRSMVVEFVNGCADIQALNVQVRLQGVHESSVVGTAIAAASRSHDVL